VEWGETTKGVGCGEECPSPQWSEVWGYPLLRNFFVFEFSSKKVQDFMHCYCENLTVAKNQDWEA